MEEGIDKGEGEEDDDEEEEEEEEETWMECKPPLSFCPTVVVTIWAEDDFSRE